MKRISFKFKSLIIFLFIIILPINTIGCSSSSKKEIEQLLLVLAVGIDLAPDDNIEVTMQLLNPAVSSSQTGNSAAAGGEVIIFKAIGHTFHEAVYEASKSLSKAVHFGHIKYVVLSDAFARGGIGNLIDSLARIEEFRLSVPILITKGKATEVVEMKTANTPVPALRVENQYIRQETVGLRPFSYLIDFVNELNSESASPVAAVIKAIKSPWQSSDNIFDLSGAAVFKKDKLVGYLNAKETRALQLVKGKVRAGDITFYSDKFGKVSCELLKNSSKIKPKIKDNKVAIEIDINIQSGISRIGANIDAVKDPKILDELAIDQSTVIKSEIQATLNAAKDDFGADIFGFADSIHKANPKKWKGIKEDWDSLFHELDINVNVKSNIRSTGFSNKSID